MIEETIPRPALFCLDPDKLRAPGQDLDQVAGRAADPPPGHHQGSGSWGLWGRKTFVSLKTGHNSTTERQRAWPG